MFSPSKLEEDIYNIYQRTNISIKKKKINGQVSSSPLPSLCLWLSAGLYFTLVGIPL